MEQVGDSSRTHGLREIVMAPYKVTQLRVGTRAVAKAKIKSYLLRLIFKFI